MAVGKLKRPQVMRMLLAGWDPHEIARALGVTAGSIRSTMREPEFATEYRAHQEAGIRKIVEMRSEMVDLAASTFVEIATSNAASDRDRLTAARELADRFGLLKESVTRIASDGEVTVVMNSPSKGDLLGNVTRK